jgi:hypothetical protein
VFEERLERGIHVAQVRRGAVGDLRRADRDEMHVGSCGAREVG